MYTVKILSNQDFERLPYRFVKESFGVADPKDNTAYVRYVAFPEVQKYMVNHEFDHLVEEIPTDEIDGVRYGFKGGFTNLFKSLGSKAANLFVGSQVPSMTTPQNIGHLSAGGPGTMGFSNPSQFLNKGVGGLKNIFSQFNNPMTKAGLLTAGAGYLMPRPKPPQLPASADVFRQFGMGGSPTGNIASQRLQEMLNQPIDKLTPEEEETILNPIRLAKRDRLKYTADVYRNLRPGTDPLTDTTYTQSLRDVENEFDLSQSRALTEAVLNKRGMRSAEIGLAKGIDLQDANVRQAIAQMDINQIQQAFNVSWQEAWYWKQLVANLGSSLIQTGMGGNPWQNMLMNLFKGGNP